MADTKISALPAATTPLAGTEVLPIVQSSVTVKVSVDNLTVKNIRSNATNGILQIAGPAAAATRVMTTPDANFTVARTDAAQSFTGNQTLSTGNLVIGTSGQGIDFSATPGTGTSELLADYEEGNWSPSRSGFTEVLGAGSITTTGRYIKVGNTVTTQASIVCTGGATIAALSGVGSSLGNLPFAPTTLGAGAWVNGTSVANDGGFLVHTNGNFYITTGWVASSSTFYFSATYLTI